MLGQQRRVGGSFDWRRLRFTMDEVSAEAVREAFYRLYRDGLAYRTEALVNWCPGCRTSVSRPRGDPDARRPARSGRSATTSSTRRPASPTPTRRSPSRRHAPRRSSATPPSRSIPDDPRYRDLVGRNGPDPVRRARRAGHRRRGRRARVRDRRGEDHAGPRPRRLRHRPPPRPADDHGPRRRRGHHRDRDAVRRPGPLRGAEADPRGPRGARRPRERRGRTRC